jgi:hypothetical protein
LERLGRATARAAGWRRLWVIKAKAPAAISAKQSKANQIDNSQEVVQGQSNAVAILV